MPRLKGLADQALYRVHRGIDYGPLDPLLRNVIDITIIVEQWDQLVRIAPSLEDRLTPGAFRHAAPHQRQPGGPGRQGNQ